MLSKEASSIIFFESLVMVVEVVKVVILLAAFEDAASQFPSVFIVPTFCFERKVHLTVT